MPSLNKTISLIRAEQSRRGVMLYVQPLEGSAMVSASTTNGIVKTAAPPEHGSGIEKGPADLSRAINKDTFGVLTARSLDTQRINVGNSIENIELQAKNGVSRVDNREV